MNIKSTQTRKVPNGFGKHPKSHNDGKRRTRLSQLSQKRFVGQFIGLCQGEPQTECRFLNSTSFQLVSTPLRFVRSCYNQGNAISVRHKIFQKAHGKRSRSHKYYVIFLRLIHKYEYKLFLITGSQFRQRLAIVIEYFRFGEHPEVMPLLVYHR